MKVYVHTQGKHIARNHRSFVGEVKSYTEAKELARSQHQSNYILFDEHKDDDEITFSFAKY